MASGINIYSKLFVYQEFEFLISTIAIVDIKNYNYCDVASLISVIQLLISRVRIPYIRNVCPSAVSVCLSIKRVNCDKTEEKYVQIFIPHERLFSLVFKKKKWLVGGNLISEILGQPAAVGAKSPILNRYSLVAPQP